MSMKKFAGLFAAFALALSGLTISSPAAHAAKEGNDPCTKREKQVAKAEDALERVTEVFAKKKAKVKKARKEFRGSEKGAEKRAARKELTKAKAKKNRTKKAKKAQVMRLAKAQERLETCQEEAAEEEPEDPAT